MQYSIPDVIKAVRIILEENEYGQPLSDILDTNSLGLDSIIQKSIPVAVTHINSLCPWYLLEGTTILNGSGSDIRIPSGARPIYAKCAEWSIPVTKFHSTDSVEYKKEKFGVEGVHANRNKPSGFLVSDATVQLCPSGTIEKFIYVDLPKEIDGKIEISGKVFEATCYYTAHLVKARYGTPDNSMLEVAVNLIKSMSYD